MAVASALRNARRLHHHLGNYLCASRNPSLAQLITIYAWLRVATTLMTALSAWRLRKTHGTLERPFHNSWR